MSDFLKKEITTKKNKKDDNEFIKINKTKKDIISHEINLLPDEYVNQQRLQKKLVLISVMVILECICFVGWIVFPPKQEIAQVEAETQLLSSQLTSEKYLSVSKALNDLENVKAKLTLWEAELESLEQKKYITAQSLDEIINIVPIGVVINEFTMESTYSDNRVNGVVINISGKGASIAEIINYETGLEHLFKNDVKLGFSRTKDSTYYDYNISIVQEDTYPISPVNASEVAISGEEVSP